MLIFKKMVKFNAVWLYFAVTISGLAIEKRGSSVLHTFTVIWLDKTMYQSWAFLQGTQA